MASIFAGLAIIFGESLALYLWTVTYADSCESTSPYVFVGLLVSVILVAAGVGSQIESLFKRKDNNNATNG